MKKSYILDLVCLLALLIWFLSHLPFFSADADLNSSPGSRGAWTDEGLYSGQIRNYINHGSFDILEGDAFLKSPLFSACLFIPFKLFGIHLEVARAMVLLLLAASLFIFYLFKSCRTVFFILITVSLMSFTVHQYSHLALAEMCAVGMILLAAISYSHYRSTKQKDFLLYVFLFLTAAVLMKLQFIYVLAIPVFALLAESFTGKTPVINKPFIASAIYMLTVFLLFYLMWFIPFKNEFNLISKLQESNSNRSSISFDYFLRNIYGHFFNKHIIYFTLCFLVTFAVALRSVFKRSMLPPMHSLLVFAIIWNVAEMHKLWMEYLPVRYLVSLYTSMGLTVAVVLAHFISKEKNNILRVCSMGIIAVLIITNCTDYYHAYQRRTFVLSGLNQYFAQNDLKDKTVIGPWAPSLTWESGSISFPVWKNFLRTSSPLKSYKPSIVISENNQEDSQGAYFDEGVDLAAVSDSVKKIKIAYWDVNIFSINQQKLSSYMSIVAESRLPGLK